MIEDADRLLGPAHPDRMPFMQRLSRLIGEPGLIDLAHALDGGPREIASPAVVPDHPARPAEAGPETCSPGPAEAPEEGD